jgi:glutathione S-transferase
VKRPRLVTLAFSHYNEKARWALDWCGIAYDERRYLPFFSQLAVLIATRGRGGRADRVSSRLSTPVLVTGDGRALCDSTDIARWASASLGGGDGPLFPEPEVLALVEQFGDQLGPYTRLAAYYHVLRAPRAMRELVARNVDAAQTLAFRALAPIAKPALVRSLGIDAARTARALTRVDAQLDAVEARLATREYLVGDRFTAADLTFAALLAPVLLLGRDDGYGAAMPDPADLLPETLELVGRMRARRAGRFALEIYRRHRRERATSPS